MRLESNFQRKDVLIKREHQKRRPDLPGNSCFIAYKIISLHKLWYTIFRVRMSIQCADRPQIDKNCGAMEEMLIEDLSIMQQMYDLRCIGSVYLTQIIKLVSED